MANYEAASAAGEQRAQSMGHEIIGASGRTAQRNEKTRAGAESRHVPLRAPALCRLTQHPYRLAQGIQMRSGFLLMDSASRKPLR